MDLCQYTQPDQPRKETDLRKNLLAARMPHLLQAGGEAVVAGVMRRSPLLAFDFDGTLAPIARTPAEARVPQPVSRRLQRLAARLPVAVVTGRSVEDVRGRLGFEPRYVVGNHGAELGPDSAQRDAGALDPVRQLLHAHAAALVAAGVTVEDKGLSLALHYRLARCPESARQCIRETLSPLASGFRIFGGKMVENVAPQDAADKSDAVHLLVRHCGADCAVFMGDDANDEPVFASAPPDWVTIRVGREDPASRAAYFLDSTAEVAMLLDRMLAHLGA